MKRTLLAASLAALGTAALAQPGYVTQNESMVWMNPYGLCWRQSTWTAENAMEPCDAVPRAAAPVAPPAPQAAPASPP